jgi:hypothetical protein
LYPLYIFTSSSPCSLLLFTPFVLPFLHIKSHPCSSILPPTLHSLIFFSHVHSISENNAMVEKTDLDIAAGSCSLLHHLCVSAHLHVCPQLAPKLLDEFLAPIGALQMSSHQNAKFLENSSNFKKIQ